MWCRVFHSSLLLAARKADAIVQYSSDVLSSMLENTFRVWRKPNEVLGLAAPFWDVSKTHVPIDVLCWEKSFAYFFARSEDEAEPSS